MTPLTLKRLYVVFTIRSVWLVTEDLLKRAYELGFKYERDYRNCAQCTYAAVRDVLGIGSDDVFKAAYGLSGGSASLGTGNCGAYSGGILAISSKYGRKRLTDERTTTTRELSRKLYERFVDEYGSCICHDIQRRIFGRTFDLWDLKDREEFEKAGGHIDKCPSVVGKAAKWVTEILLDAEKANP